MVRNSETLNLTQDRFKDGLESRERSDTVSPASSRTPSMTVGSLVCKTLALWTIPRDEVRYPGDDPIGLRSGSIGRVEATNISEGEICHDV